MIFAETKQAKEDQFKALLSRSKELLMQSLKDTKEILPLSFEEAVCLKMNDAAIGSVFEGKIKQTGLASFPDIIANGYYGVEVKMTAKDSWTSTGNSILESSRIPGIERIYIMFGKFGGNVEIIFRLYQECLPEISVTHSPRYRIDMKLPIGQSIFDKMKIDYDALRKEDKPIQTIKTYYRNRLKDGEELWWIDQESGDKIVSPIIRSFKSLTKAEKNDFEVESMILFPEIFGKSQSKYERVAAYLIASQNVVSANIRDHFTAGGQRNLALGDKMIRVKKINFKLFNNAKIISEKIKIIDAATLMNYWRVNTIEENRLDQWKKILIKKNDGENSKKVLDIFEAGLI